MPLSSLYLLIVVVGSNFNYAVDAPNVVLIMTDDQGYGDFGATGNNTIQTPNIDAMASRSARWNEFYVSPVCSPTRACLMTGRYNHRTKCIDTFKGRSMMASDETTIAELLADAGYATGIFGKWHLGDNYPMRPGDQGFQESLVHKGGGIGQPSEPIVNQRRYTDAVLFQNDRQVSTQGYCTDVFFDSALRFIEEQSNNNKPFFSYIALNAPHGPFHDVPAAMLNHYQQKQFDSIIPVPKLRRSEKELDKLARISAMITNIDDNIGKLFRKLDELKLKKQTMVIFMTDNGPNTRRFVGPFRGKKSELHEGGIRSPLWVHWPGKIKPGSIIRNSVAAHIDIMPTILDACEIELRPVRKMDGRSVWPKLQNPEVELPVRPLVIQYHRGDTPSRYHSCMIRKGPWKLVNPSGTQKTVLPEEPNWELYNLAVDPAENNDLSKQHTETIRELKLIYDQWFDDVVAERKNEAGPPDIIIDSKHENPAVLSWQDMIGGTWRSDTVGYYKLRIENDCVANIRYDAQPSYKFDESSLWTAIFEIGEQSLSVPFQPEKGSVVFRNVNLSSGRTQLRPFFVSANGKKVAAYHVTIEHHSTRNH